VIEGAGRHRTGGTRIVSMSMVWKDADQSRVGGQEHSTSRKKKENGYQSISKKKKKKIRLLQRDSGGTATVAKSGRIRKHGRNDDGKRRKRVP